MAIIEDYESPVTSRFYSGREDFDSFVTNNTNQLLIKRGTDRLGAKLVYYPIYKQIAYSTPSRHKFCIVGVFRVGNTACCLASEGKSTSNVLGDLFWLVNKRTECNIRDSFALYMRLMEDLFKNNYEELSSLIRQSLKSVGMYT